MILSKFFRTSKESKQQQGFWKKYLWFIALSYHDIFNVKAYDLLAQSMSSVPKEYQWILAVLSPLLREYGILIVTKISSMASSGVAPHKLVVRHFIQTRHTVYLSIILEGIATPESALCILAMDFLINIFHGLKIVRKSNSGKNGEQNLISNEIALRS